MLFDSVLIAHLSRFQPGVLLVNLVKDLGCPTITSGLQCFSRFPMEGVGQQEMGIIAQVFPLVHDEDALFGLAFESDTLGEDP